MSAHQGPTPAAGLPPQTKARLADLLPLITRHRALLATAVLISLVASVATLVQPLVVGQVIQRVGSGELLGPMVWALVGLIIASGVLTGVQHYLLRRLGANVVLGARRDLVHRMLRLPVKEYETRPVGDLVSRVGTDTTMLAIVISQGLVDLLGSVLVFTGALIALLLIDPLLLGVSSVVLAGSVLAVTLLSKQLRTVTVEQQKHVGMLAASVNRALTAIRTIRAANATGRETERINEHARRAWRANLDVARIAACVAPVSGIATQVALVTVLGLGGAQVAAGRLTLVDLVQFIMFLFLLVMPLGNVFTAIASVSQALGALGRIQEITQIPLEREKRTEPSEDAEVSTSTEISFDGVSFTYSTADAVTGEGDGVGGTLGDVTFDVRRGSRVAVVGPSGAGKSTLLALLARFYDADAGTIRVDGRDIRTLDHETVRARLGYVEQDAPVLSGTIRDNLLISAPDATDAECRDVLAAVNLTGFLEARADGLDTLVGESGVLLSGGERQRLAIARALLHGPPVLLLDESTSHLDGLNERMMRDALETAAEGRTLLVVAHRLSTVVDSDHIVVLDGGRVVGTGTHDELLRSTPLYAALAAEQLLTPEAQPEETPVSGAGPVPAHQGARS